MERKEEEEEERKENIISQRDVSLFFFFFSSPSWKNILRKHGPASSWIRRNPRGTTHARFRGVIPTDDSATRGIIGESTFRRGHRRQAIVAHRSNQNFHLLSRPRDFHANCLRSRHQSLSWDNDHLDRLSRERERVLFLACSCLSNQFSANREKMAVKYPPNILVIRYILLTLENGERIFPLASSCLFLSTSINVTERFLEEIVYFRR